MAAAGRLLCVAAHGLGLLGEVEHAGTPLALGRPQSTDPRSPRRTSASRKLSFSPVCVRACVRACVRLLAELSEGHADRIAALWRSQVMELAQAAVDASLMVNQLVDMEWRFGVSVASDEVEKVRWVACALRVRVRRVAQRVAFFVWVRTHTSCPLAVFSRFRAPTRARASAPRALAVG